MFPLESAPELEEKGEKVSQISGSERTWKKPANLGSRDRWNAGPTASSPLPSSESRINSEMWGTNTDSRDPDRSAVREARCSPAAAEFLRQWGHWSSEPERVSLGLLGEDEAPDASRRCTGSLPAVQGWNILPNIPGSDKSESSERLISMDSLTETEWCHQFLLQALVA